MYVIDILRNECLRLATTLNDTLYMTECRHIDDTTNVSTSVMEFAASTLIAQLAYAVALWK